MAASVFQFSRPARANILGIPRGQIIRSARRRPGVQAVLKEAFWRTANSGWRALLQMGLLQDRIHSGARGRTPSEPCGAPVAWLSGTAAAGLCGQGGCGCEAQGECDSADPDDPASAAAPRDWTGSSGDCRNSSTPRAGLGYPALPRIEAVAINSSSIAIEAWPDTAYGSSVGRSEYLSSSEGLTLARFTWPIVQPAKRRSLTSS